MNTTEADENSFLTNEMPRQTSDDNSDFIVMTRSHDLDRVDNTASSTNFTSQIPLPILDRPESTWRSEICRQVIRAKLAKRRHAVLPRLIHPPYLEALFPGMLLHFAPQAVHYNGGVAGITEWKISCYLEVMPGGVPTTHPNLSLLQLFLPLLTTCNDLFSHWYRQQHACNNRENQNNIHRSHAHQSSCTDRDPHNAENKDGAHKTLSCRRLMTFVTRYTPSPGEQALLKHVDGAGQVDGSLVLALPMDRWSDPDQDLTFEGGGLTFWDGRTAAGPEEIHYDTRSGDVAFIDRAVWHQADPVTKGVRWALVIFYKVENSD